LSTFGQVFVNDNPGQNFVSLTHENVAATSQQANEWATWIYYKHSL